MVAVIENNEQAYENNQVNEVKESNNQANERLVLAGFILSIVGVVLMCFSIIPLVGIIIFFASAGVIIVSENILNKYKSETQNPSKLCKIGKILTLVGACLSVVFLVISVILTII